MPTIKQTLGALGIAVAATLLTGVVAFLNEVHLEVSFDKLKDFKSTDLESYAKLGTALRFDVESAVAQDFVAYWVDDERGKPIVRKSSISYKNFRLSNRIAGKLIDDDDKQSYAITGYYNSNKIVFSHRGPISGTGVYVLDLVRIDDLPGRTYAGYAIIDEGQSGSRMTTMLQCPFVMIDEDLATKKVVSNEAAIKAFSFLGTACTPFNLPENVTTATVK
jgi:hypothetical protein